MILEWPESIRTKLFLIALTQRDALKRRRVIIFNRGNNLFGINNSFGCLALNDRDAISSQVKSSEVFLQNGITNGEITFLNDLLQDDEVKSRLDIIDKEIDDRIGEGAGEPLILYETARHLLVAGGKRLRSLLVILSCEAVGGNIERALPFAVATEFAQTASLIHDDVIDEDILRRGVEAAHQKYGQKMAILAGDLLVAQAVKMIGNHATAELLVQVAEGGIRMCEGEAFDMLMNADNPEAMTIESYLKMVEKKTVAFIKTATTMGASIGGGSPEQSDALGRYGENLGYAFQIRDDILNLISTKEIVGKSVQSDLISKRCTYPLVYALDAVTTEERNSCLKALASGDVSPARMLIDKTDAISQSVMVTQNYVQIAKDALQSHAFTTSPLLEKIADFVLQRLH
jgi:geranylgeranyl pyrophosphate synthase